MLLLLGQLEVPPVDLSHGLAYAIVGLLVYAGTKFLPALLKKFDAQPAPGGQPGPAPNGPAPSAPAPAVPASPAIPPIAIPPIGRGGLIVIGLQLIEALLSKGDHTGAGSVLKSLEPHAPPPEE